MRIPPVLDQDIKHLAVLIDRATKIIQLALAAAAIAEKLHVSTKRTLSLQVVQIARSSKSNHVETRTLILDDRADTEQRLVLSY